MLGGAVAVDLASRVEYSCRIWCIILENTFTSIPDIAVALFKNSWFLFLPLLFYKNKVRYIIFLIILSHL